MDYFDNSHVTGVTQFNKPETKLEACSLLRRVYAQCQDKLRVVGEVRCGNGVLEENEECECVNSSTRCEGCVDCEQTKECSLETHSWVPTSLLDMNHDNLPIAGGFELSPSLMSPECCSQNTLSPTTQACMGTHDRGFCAMGVCTNQCRAVGLFECGTKGRGCEHTCTKSLGSTRCKSVERTRWNNARPKGLFLGDGVDCGGGFTCTQGKCTNSTDGGGSSSMALNLWLVLILGMMLIVV